MNTSPGNSGTCNIGAIATYRAAAPRLFGVALLICMAFPVSAAEPVTIDNFRRAESDHYFKTYVDKGCFGKLCSDREAPAVDKQDVIRMNRDTPYSAGVFDLTTPVTIVKPETGKRFQSMLIINEDQYNPLVAYKAGSYTLTQESVGTRYVAVLFRTFMDPNDPADVQSAHAAQDAKYIMGAPKVSDGKTPYVLTVKDVPVDGFWSVTVYNDKGYFEAPENAISVNNVTGKRNKDGSMTIHVGGDPQAVNYLRTMPGWNYIVRLYRPRAEILDGTWTFPEPTPVR